METIPLTEIMRLKLQNCNLSLQVLNLQANKVIEEKKRIILSECETLKLKPEEWQLDEQSWEYVRISEGK